MQEFVREVWSVLLSGGWVMIPLFMLAVLLYTQAFQLAAYVKRANVAGSDDPEQWNEWIRNPESAPGLLAEVIRYSQTDTSSIKQIRNRFDEIRLALLDTIDRRSKFVNMLVSAAPLLGLLGTVLGMLATFFGIATGGGADAAGSVAGGISAALVTTQTGLTIALPGLFIVSIIQRQRQKLQAKLARLESLTLLHFKQEAS